MVSPYEKLTRILQLERHKGGRDDAVTCGMDEFLTIWQSEARAAQEGSAEPLISVSEILATLQDYRQHSPDERLQAVGRVLAKLQQAEAPAIATERPTPAPAAGRPAAGQPVAARPARPPTRHAPGMTLDTLLGSSGLTTSMQLVRLARLELHTIRDVLYHFPRRYDDYAHLKKISNLFYGDEVTIIATVEDVNGQHSSRGQHVLRVIVSDDTGRIEISFFNQAYLEQKLRVGSQIVISGQVGEFRGRLVFTSPEWEPLQGELLNTMRLVPVYPLTEGLGAKWLRKFIKQTLDAWAGQVPDPLPEEMRARLELLPIARALAQMHFPESKEALAQARRRLCFDEFLALQLGLLHQRHERRIEPSQAMQVPQELIEDFAAQLPFALTAAQQRVTASILDDLRQPVPMNRLLQGDVGSGKTVVAVMAILAAVKNGCQAAVMAPTSILAEQHYATMSTLLQGMPDIHVALLVGNLNASAKQRLHDEIAEGRAQVVIGTHALIQSSVSFANLGLVVVDEQHRFGVSQRAALRAKGESVVPHVLAMSATPIPRTLALTVYGDLDVSVIDELPPNRQKVVTAVRDAHGRARVYQFIEEQVAEGRQAFIICPLIEESDTLDAKAAKTEYKRLQTEVFPHLKLGLLHGRMKAEEKDRAMLAFKQAKYDILVSTAVVEVGIDIPNATVILIEGAERFGLAQLHQFRGRVGRGEWKSYCILLSEDDSPESINRLRIMEETDDGFALAEQDLEMRGPGDFFGMRQHGLPPLRVANLSDTAILELARQEAATVFASDPELEHAEHRLLAERVQQFWGEQVVIE